MIIDYEKLYDEAVEKIIELQERELHWWHQLELKQFVEEFEKTKKKYGFDVVQITFESGYQLNLVYSQIDNTDFKNAPFNEKVIKCEVVTKEPSVEI